MTVCKVLLFGLKPCDLSSSTNDNIAETSNQRQPSLIPTTSSSKLTKENSSSPDKDYLDLDIKPLLTPTSSVRKNKEFLRSFFLLNTFILAFFNKQ
jgi:hypothetical protein